MRGFFVRQKDVMQCGIACLSMVCRWHGADIDIDKIEKLCPSSREGVSLLALSETAAALGLLAAFILAVALIPSPYDPSRSIASHLLSSIL